MPNHHHLLIETPQANLAWGMCHLNGVYTRRFNRSHKRVGHVFQGRYKTIVVQKDAHLPELCRYVVLNPVRARLVKSVREWRWSSYLTTAAQRGGPTWLTTDWLWTQFADTPQRAVWAYRRFVTEGLEKQPWQDLTGQMYYGYEDFIITVARETKSREVPRRQPLRPALAQVVQRGTPEEVGRAYREYGYRFSDIAHHLGVHYSSVSRRLKGSEARQHV